MIPATWRLACTAAVETLRTMLFPPITQDDIPWSDPTGSSPFSPYSQVAPSSPNADLPQASAEASASLPPLSPEHPQANPRKATAPRRGKSAEKR